MNKYNGFNPQYMTEGMSNNGKLNNILDTRAMYKTPEKALPKLIALTSDYAEDAKYLVGKPFNLDATFSYKLKTSDLSNIKWEVTPKDALRERIVAMKPDPKTVRKVYLPLKEGEVTIKVSFTDSKKAISTQTIKLQIGKAVEESCSLETTKIVSCMFTDPTVEELKVGEEKEIKIVFDRAVPANEEISIITSPNLKSKLGFNYAADRKSGTISINATEVGYAYFKVSTTGTPYVGFSDIPVVENPDMLTLVGISPAQSAYEGEQVTVKYSFNKNVESATPEGFKIIISDPTVVTEDSRSNSGKDISVVYNCEKPGTTNITASVNGTMVKTMVRTDNQIPELVK